MAIKVLSQVTTSQLEDFIYDIDVGDPKLYEELKNPYKIGLFQINGSTAEQLCDKMLPENFAELTAFNAMARPGPMEASAPYYVKRKAGEKSPYPDVLNNLIQDTHQVFIYQEQVMEIFHKIGGFTLEEANEVRSLMKKLGKLEKDPKDLKKWDATVQKFTNGAMKNGITESMAKTIATDLAAFSSYSFCKAHASSYAYIAAITIYLSIYYRRWFYASVLAYEVDREKYLLDRLYSVKNQKIDILPPDINKSQVHFVPEGENVRFGLADIKYVSVMAAEIIMKNRPYSSLFDFIMKTRSRIITSKTIKALISVGAFDFLTKERKRLIMVFDAYWDKRDSSKIVDKLRATYEEGEACLMNIAGLDTTEDDLVVYEKEYFGFRFFSSPFKGKITEDLRQLRLKNIIYISLAEVGSTPKKVPVFINSVRNHKDKNGNPMAFIEIEDVRGNRMTVPIFYSHFQYMGDLISENSLYLMYLYNENGKLFFGKKERIDNYAENERRKEAARWLGKRKT